MKAIPLFARLCAIAAACSLGAAAQAQSPIAYKCHCHQVGAAQPEPVGDRDGHALLANSYSCRIEGGPLDGGVLTGSNIIEWDQGSAVFLASNGVIRKPGALTAFQVRTGKSVTTDGKVTGYVGDGTYALAAGAGSVLQGKTFTYASRPTGPGQFVIDVKVE